MERVNIFFLHGFLGTPQDWRKVQEALPSHDRLKVFSPDYFHEGWLNPETPLHEWGERFNRWVEQKSASGDRNILVGYSLGGRLSLHALAAKPGLWYKSILVSTNPGFDDELSGFEPDSDIRRQRWLQDSYWAEEFGKAPWEMLLRNWNAQAVFGGGSEEPTRDEKQFSRELLGLALTQWSLAQQRNMRPVIQTQQGKISLLVGERDEKFVDMALNLKEEIPNLKVDIVPDASHRILFDRPREVAEKIKSLLKQIL